MTNRELMAHPDPTKLSGIERQRYVVLHFQSRRMPCPSCGTRQNWYEAARISVDDYDPHQHYDGNPHRCIACGRRLVKIVPVISSDPWHWSLVPMPPDTPEAA